MQFQLILQFRGVARAYFDGIENSPSRLAKALGVEASLDGEDIGAHGANLFIYTTDARKSLSAALSIFPAAKSTAGFTAAYRQVSSDVFRVLWPEESPASFSLR